MLKTTDLGQMFVNLRHVRTDRQLIQEVYFHTVLMYTKFLFNSEERGKAHKGIIISIIHLTPGSAELSLSKTGQVVNSFEGI